MTKFQITANFAAALFQVLQNQKQTNTGGLTKLLKFKIDAKVILAANVDIQDCFINRQIGNTRHTEFAQGSVLKVFM